MKTYTVEIDSDGDKFWYLDGKLHREECADGDKFWYLDGKLHREDGPAIEFADGDKFWYLDGKELTEAEFNARNKPKPTCEGKVVEVDGVKYRLVKA
jgi:hypothetical protein